MNLNNDNHLTLADLRRPLLSKELEESATHSFNAQPSDMKALIRLMSNTILAGGRQATVELAPFVWYFDVDRFQQPELRCRFCCAGVHRHSASGQCIYGPTSYTPREPGDYACVTAA